MKKIYIILFIILAGFSTYYFLGKNNKNEQAQNTKSEVSANDPKNISYNIEGKEITLKNGHAESEVAPDSSSKLITDYFGNSVSADMNGDGLEDQAFLLVQDGGGTGNFFYVVAAINTPDGYQGTNAIFLGDRIAPQTTEFKDGEIIVNYADRNKGEAMTQKPSLGVSRYFKIQNGILVEILK